MRKSELEKLRTLNATPAMIRALQEPGTKRYYSGKINEEKYHLAARCQQLGGYLKISICTREDISKKVYTPKWDIFEAHFVSKGYVPDLWDSRLP